MGLSRAGVISGHVVVLRGGHGGDHLTPREIADLLRKRKEIDRGGSCPHGRPTTMRLSIEELEQRFGRR